MKRRGLRSRTGEESSSAVKLSRSSRLLRSKKTMGFAALVIMGSFAVWGYSYLQAPAEGVVADANTASPQTEGISTSTLSGKSYRLELPGGYVAQEIQKPVAPIAEQQRFLARRGAFESRTLTLIIKKSPPASFTEESALLFRERSSDYKTDVLDVPAGIVNKFSKKDGTEITFFVKGPSAYAIISTTSTNPGDSYAQEVARIINSFSWK